MKNQTLWCAWRWRIGRNLDQQKRSTSLLFPAKVCLDNRINFFSFSYPHWNPPGYIVVLGAKITFCNINQWVCKLYTFMLCCIYDLKSACSAVGFKREVRWSLRMVKCCPIPGNICSEHEGNNFKWFYCFN